MIWNMVQSMTCWVQKLLITFYIFCMLTIAPYENILGSTASRSKSLFKEACFAIFKIFFERSRLMPAKLIKYIKPISCCEILEHYLPIVHTSFLLKTLLCCHFQGTCSARILLTSSDFCRARHECWFQIIKTAQFMLKKHNRKHSVIESVQV